MRKVISYLTIILATLFFSLSLFAQQIKLSGVVKNITDASDLAAVSVLVKGTGNGTITDDHGAFTLLVPKLPVVLIVSSVGYATKQITVNDASSPLQIDLEIGSSLGQEVVVSATRMPERILESPVSIERVNAAAISNAALPNYYDVVRNLKGVDLTTSSITFKTISTRGFNGSGNLRFNQLVDGMDNQAPVLNFSVGGINGPIELDVDNMELLPGASSALYGPGGMNGTLLITSKDPFTYQGLSVQIKQGVNHIGDDQRSAAPYYDWALRWGKVVNEKFAFKISSQYIKAQDWEAHDSRNILRTNVFSKVTTGDRQTDPNYDGVNFYGDEASTNMNSVAEAAIFQVSQLALPMITQQVSAQCGCVPTQAQINAALGNFLSTNTQTRPFYLGMQNKVFTSSNYPFVSRTGYEEKAVVNYDAYNLKINGGLYYKINSTTEASVLGYWGAGTTVYTGADRYVLKNLRLGQYKAEVKASKWFLRAGTTRDHSGDSYTATTAALYVNNTWRSNADWFGLYTGTYGGARLQGASDAQAHAIARAAADQGRYLPGTDAFKTAFDNAINTPIGKGGAKFEDKTSLYNFEGQYNISDYVKVVDVLVGANYRVYHLNTNGSVFVDTTGPININEYGAYVQLQKSLWNDVLKLTGSLRYDKNENFKGRVTPRATALVKVAPNNNIRFSYQTAYRFPQPQDQYINLLTGGANRLIGGLPQFETFFKFNTNPAYTAESVAAYRNSIRAGVPNPTLLKQAMFQVIKPETMRSFEIGYRGLLTSKLLFDAYGYYSKYQQFIDRVAVGRGKSGDPAKAASDLASPFTTDNYSFVVNSKSGVSAIGWGISAEYQFGKGFTATANISGDELRNVEPDHFTQFNTPKLRYNIGLGNNKIGKYAGFNLMWRWQDQVNWEGTFATGDIPAFGTLDAQINYKFPSIKSVVKLGGSNVLNHYYYSAFGNPQIGAIYYISFGFNVL